MSEHDDVTDQNETRESRRPSALLLIVGLAALLVSVWALLGPISLAPAANFQLRWLFVGAAVVAGLLLVILPNRRGRK